MPRSPMHANPARSRITSLSSILIPLLESGDCELCRAFNSMTSILLVWRPSRLRCHTRVILLRAHRQDTHFSSRMTVHHDGQTIMSIGCRGG
jgi:hypothetical protein